MKNISLSFFLILLTTLYGLGQKMNNEEPLIGEWINHWSTPKTELGKLYQNDSTTLKKQFGQHLIFNENGTFIDVYYAPCGTDGDIHKYIGKWKFTKNTIEVYDLKEQYNKAHSYSIFPDDSDMILNETGTFKIIKLENGLLQLEIIENYELKADTQIKE